MRVPLASRDLIHPITGTPIAAGAPIPEDFPDLPNLLATGGAHYETPEVPTTATNPAPIAPLPPPTTGAGWDLPGESL